MELLVNSSLGHNNIGYGTSWNSDLRLSISITVVGLTIHNFEMIALRSLSLVYNCIDDVI